MGKELLRNLPKVDVLMNEETVLQSGQNLNPEMKKEQIRAYLEELREEILAEKRDCLPSGEEMLSEIQKRLEQADTYSLRRVINATGVVLHTNLGRAPLGEEVMDHLAKELVGYNTLEYDLEAAKRGSRYSHVEKILCEITGTEAAMVVNNNAAAVFLVLNTLASRKNVAISRGELVEIGGAFRVPEIMERSWANLIEIGTTNKTHLSDYERAIEEKDASLILKVHNSNFKMIGFTEEVSVEELTKLGQEKGVKVIFDLGAAFLTEKYLPGPLQGEVPSVKRCVDAGCDIICFSGDKLFGSAQAGIILGKKEEIEKIRKNPFTRMFRIDKLTLGTLEATLRIYKDYGEAVKKIPTLRMLLAKEEELKEEAQALLEEIRKNSPEHVTAELLAIEDEPGGGSLPGVSLPGYGIALTSSKLRAEEIEEKLRKNSVPIITRISKEQVILSVRTLLPKESEMVAAAVSAL